MLTSGIFFKGFKIKKNSLKAKKKLLLIIKDKNDLILSFGNNYRNSFKKKTIAKYKKFKNIRVIGMGGSTLGSQTIYDFLKHKIGKNFLFIDNLQPKQKKTTKQFLSLVISKSGNTTETIANANIIIKKKDRSIFITENKDNYLHKLAKKLKSEVIHHNNYIGGRYSVLSEVGMLPAELMGLKSDNFRQFNSLVKNTKFLNALISNVTSTLFFIQKGKFNSIIINYDEKSDSLFNWYQQLIAESLGKKKKGLLPIVSSMPKDNHSVMQLYLDGFQKNFFTFFYVHENKSDKINNSLILPSQKFLKNKKITDIIYAQKIATEKVFDQNKIPYRSFEIKKRNEKTLGELFCFFMLETILIGNCLKINPFDQPAVELIKQQTKKILI